MGLHDIIQPLAVAEIDNFTDIDYHNITKAAFVLRALNNKLRQQLIKTIHQHKNSTVQEYSDYSLRGLLK